MRKSMAGVWLAIGMFCTSYVGLAKDHAYVQGKLLDASVDEREKKGTTQAHAIYTVQVADMVYTVRGESVSAKAKDITKGLIVGDPVEAAVDGQHVFLRTPNGKQIKTDVLKRARPQTP